MDRRSGTLLELAVLGLLKEQPMSGYELQKQLVATLGFWRVSFGSLYPCLHRLLEAGALSVEENTCTSRRKRTYRLTTEGETRFVELLESADSRELERDRFALRLAFFRYLQPEARLAQLEQRRGYLQLWVAEVQLSLRHARDRMDAYTLSLMDHGVDEREREIAWLDRLIAAERGVGPKRPRRVRHVPPRDSAARPRGAADAGEEEPKDALTAPTRGNGTGPLPVQAG